MAEPCGGNFRLGRVRGNRLAEPVSDVTSILQAVEQGDSKAAAELLPLVYEELRKLAARKLADHREPQTLQATALVHEAWLRLNQGENHRWAHRQHFFAAAAQAMRHILVDNARRKARPRHGGRSADVSLDELDLAGPSADDHLMRIEEALADFESAAPEKARVVVLKFFGGMTNQEVAEELRVTERTVERHWAYAKVWLLHRMRAGD
jgi:RNA polymerase sigma factor (TIGR02999 family)